MTHVLKGSTLFSHPHSFSCFQSGSSSLSSACCAFCGKRYALQDSVYDILLCLLVRPSLRAHDSPLWPPPTAMRPDQRESNANALQ